MLNDNKLDIIKKFGYTSKQIGLAEVQVIILTHRIKYLTIHFKTHKKDEHSRRGLFKMSSKRKKLLKYLKNSSLITYQNILNVLKLRK